MVRDRTNECSTSNVQRATLKWGDREIRHHEYPARTAGPAVPTTSVERKNLENMLFAKRTPHLSIGTGTPYAGEVSNLVSRNCERGTLQFGQKRAALPADNRDLETCVSAKRTGFEINNFYVEQSEHQWVRMRKRKIPIRFVFSKNKDLNDGNRAGRPTIQERFVRHWNYYMNVVLSRFR
jgi:hypothetical protein